MVRDHSLTKFLTLYTAFSVSVCFNHHVFMYLCYCQSLSHHFPLPSEYSVPHYNPFDVIVVSLCTLLEILIARKPPVNHSATAAYQVLLSSGYGNSAGNIRSCFSLLPFLLLRLDDYSIGLPYWIHALNKREKWRPLGETLRTNKHLVFSLVNWRYA